MSDARNSHTIRLVEADNYWGEGMDDEVWWMTHYACDCGWESHDSHTVMSDDGEALARAHAALHSGVIEP